MSPPLALTRPPGALTLDDDDGTHVWCDGRYHRLSTTGGLIWRLLDGRDLDGLLGALAEQTSVPIQVLVADVEAFLSELRDADLLHIGDAVPAPPEPTGRTLRPEDRKMPLPDHETRLRGWYQALDHAFAVRTNDDVVGRMVSSALRDLEGPPTPGSPEYVVERTADGWRAGVAGRLLFEAPNRDQVVRRLLWHVNDRILRDDREHLVLHAGAVVLDGRALIFLGGMNAGKSTITTYFGLRGIPILSDEFAPVGVRSGLVRPFPRAINLSPHSARALGIAPGTGMSTATDGRRPDLHHIPCSALPGGIAPDPVPFGTIVAYRYADGASIEVSEVGFEDAVSILMRNSMPQSGTSPDERFATAIGIARRANVLQMRSGSLRDAFDRLRSVHDPGATATGEGCDR